MKNYARIIDNVAVDVSSDPAKHFHPQIAADFEAVPVEVRPGWRRDETGWYAPPVQPEPPAPEPQTATAIRRAEIEVELTAIDAASARPLRAILTATTNGGTADPADAARLAELEAKAVALRSELATLAEPEA